MIQTAFQGETIYLLNDSPNWPLGFSTDFELVTDIQAGLTKIEARRPYSLFLRLAHAKFTCSIADAALITFQAQMRNLTSERVALPFWPALEYWVNRLSNGLQSGLMIAFKPDWSQYEIYEAGSEPGWPLDADYVAPCVLGFFKTNTCTLLSPTLGRWAFDFVESSKPEHALTNSPDFTVAIDGPKPTGYGAAPPILPFIPDWSAVDETLKVEVLREQIGFERQAETTFYPHDPYRINDSAYTVYGERLNALIQFFVETAGQGSSFWALGAMASAKVAVAALAGDTAITVIDSAGLRVGDFLASVSETAVTFAKVTSIVGAVVNVGAAFGSALPVNAPLYELNLARLVSPKLSLIWKNLTVAQARLSWQEVRAEKIVPVTETLSTTIGRLPLRVALFKFTRDFGNGSTQSWYYTSAEVDIVYAGNVYLSKPFQAGDIMMSLNMENDSADFTTFAFAGNPLVDDVSMTCEAPLTCVVIYGDYDASVGILNPAQVFSGDCTTTERLGSKITIHGRFGAAMFDSDLPRFVRGQMCNHIGGSNNDGSFLISAGCTLLKSAWKFTGLVDNAISSAFPYTLILKTLTGVGADAAAALAAPRIFANWFANGWLEWGAGAAIQRRMVIGSTIPSGGAITLILHRYFKSLPSLNDVVTIYPGCDGLWATCQAYNSSSNPLGKFNNKVNFGGEPFTPIANPSASGLPTLNTQGGKK